MKGFSGSRLYGFHECSGSRFYAKIDYCIMNRFGIEVHGEDTFYVSCNVNFTSILNSVRMAQKIFEGQMSSTLSSNSTLDEIMSLVYELNELINASTDCQIVIDDIDFDGLSPMLSYKLVYPISYESVLMHGVSNMVYLYCERVLIL